MKTLCRLGLHKWRQSRPLSIFDIHPPFFLDYVLPTRKCLRCGKTQRWLPGYGGSEFGCWTSYKAG